MTTFERLWAETLNEAIEGHNSELPPEQWTVSGRATQQYPNGEDWSWWLDQGPRMLARYQEWRFEREPVWTLWTTPEGNPAIELPFRVEWGSTHLEGYIDRVYWHPFDAGELMVVDYKSGSFPSNMRQLGFYACAMELQYGHRPKYGGYYMARNGGCVLHRLDHPALSADHLIEISERVERAFDLGLFVANPGPLCRSCTVRHHCAEGSLA